MKRLVTAVVAVMTGAMVLAGCGSSGGGSASTGTLKVAIKDEMSDDCKSVVVAIKEIRAVPAGSENAADNNSGLPVIARFATPKVVDVMQLQFQSELLGEVVVPAGSYTQLRLILAENIDGQEPVNYLTLKADGPAYVKYPLTTPSGQTSGLKLKGSFTVVPNQVTAMMIDFDPNTAIHDTGNGKYMMNPTGIRLYDLKDVWGIYGALTGKFNAPPAESFLAIKQGTTTVASGSIFANISSGNFTAFVPAGSYKAFLSATGFKVYSSPLKTVTTGQSTDLGAIMLMPITP